VRVSTLTDRQPGKSPTRRAPHSAELLRERFRKLAEQHKAEQEAARVVQEAAKAERRRLEKLSQLTEKFGRKAN
jgi:ProP effector